MQVQAYCCNVNKILVWYQYTYIGVPSLVQHICMLYQDMREQSVIRMSPCFKEMHAEDLL